MIDTIDFSILTCLQRADSSLWKKRIHQELMEWEETLPLQDAVSLQTVGRRVDKLHDEGYLENTIVSPQDVPRDLIIGYTLTAKGEQIHDAKRESLLKAVVRDELFDDHQHPDIGETALAELLHNEIGAEGSPASTASHYSRDELLVLAGTYFLQKTAGTGFSDGDRQRISEAIMRQEALTTLLH